jgi:tetratricopeptide (TPR) repeat protein
MCRCICHLLTLGLAVAICGCAASKKEQAVERAVMDYFAGDYPHAREELAPLAEKTDEDFVLNNARLGSASLVDYHLDEAEAAFLRAYEVINSMGVNNGGRSLGAVLVDEKIKVWKGEPYERAMVNFYLGVIYYIRHDYANARGAFENALFKLRDYEGSDKEDKYREQESNFSLAYLMLAKSWQRLGREDLARANFKRVAELRHELEPLADYDRNLHSNVLLVVDYGYGPRKVTDFDGAIVGMAPAPWQEGPIPQPQVIVDGHSVPTDGIDRPPIDTLVMGQDRKWQSIDTIRTIKSALGTGLIAGGAIEGIRGAYGHGAAQRRDLIASAALIGAGALLKATSQADVRQWEMLPRTTFILPLELEPGEHDIRVEFSNGVKQTWRNIVAPKSGDEATYYFRMQRWNSGPFDWSQLKPEGANEAPAVSSP